MLLPPLRLFTVCPYTLEAPAFIYIVKVPVCRHTTFFFELVRHTLWHFSHWLVWYVWYIICTPLDQCLTCMYFAIPVSIFFAQSKCMYNHPLVISNGSTNPDGRWVIEVSLLVELLWSCCIGRTCVMCRAKHLRWLKYHLDNMLVTLWLCWFYRTFW